MDGQLNEGVLGYNMFAYCENNPVNRADSTGEAWYGFEVYDTYVDDGYSGTNFDRPAFQRLLTDIDNEQVNMVITKDLSRLGRDYIMTGYYSNIDKLTPEILNTIIKRIEIGHVSRKSKIKNIVKIYWKLE